MIDVTVAREIAHGARVSAPLIWPERDLHAITGVDLAPEMPPEVAAIEPMLRQLAALGDGMRALQAADGTWRDDAHIGLAENSARLMLEIAGSDVATHEQGTLIIKRAAALFHSDSRPDLANAEAALVDPQALSVLAGPLCTFRGKTRAGLHSVVACTAHRRGYELVASLDASYEGALAWACEQAGTPDVTVGQVWPMQITDLIAAGGEASAFPKHFAYFLPEDEGAGMGTANKTILFRNVYGLRYDHITAPLATRLLADEPELGDVDVRDILVGWMRGHDIAHAVTTPQTGKVGPADVGHEPWYSLQEVIADAYGTAMACSPCWLARIGCSLDDMVRVYMAEALHYLRRGPWNWSDAGAAHMELAFLVDRGYVEVLDGGGLTWETPQHVLDGIYALCAELECCVISAQDPSTVQAFIDQYAWAPRDRHSLLTQLVLALRDIGGVPTALAYL